MSLIGSIPILADPRWGWGHHAWWPWGGVMMVGWWLLVAGAVFLAVRAYRSSAAEPSRPDAVSILSGRYARGEIDEQEFRARLAVLKERR